MKNLIYLPYNKEIIQNAKELRNNLTEEEKKLWYQYLRCYPIRFTRQKTVEKFVLDFYCASCKLCIEIDGNQHLTHQGIGRDEERTRWLNAYGITVIRFANDHVRNSFGEVCTQIDAKVKSLMEPHST